MKRNLNDLAIFGGAPAFTDQLHVGRPNIGDRKRLLARIHDLLDRRWFTNEGPFVTEFEQRIEEMLGVKHCVAMSSGTVALEIAVRSAGLTGEVIVPSMTFIATAHALQWQGISPVFCDVDPTSHNLDPGCVEALITPRTTGIIGVHLWGRPCDVDSLADLAQRRNLKLLFDAAHAFYCSHNGLMIGNFGDAEVLSFHATKFLNTFEGGAVVTNDDALASTLRLARNFGFAGYDRVVALGTNGKMSEVSAAMGLTLLESLDDLIGTNYDRYKQYEYELSGIPGVRLIVYDESENCNYQYVIIEIDDKTTQISRDQLIEILWAEQILVRRYFYPGCHRSEPYRSSAPYSSVRLSVTEELCDRVLALPTGASLRAGDVETVAQIIRLAVGHGPEARRRLASMTVGNVDQ